MDKQAFNVSNSSYAQIIRNISDQFVIYASAIILIMGLIGNTLNIMIFTSLKLFRGNQSVFYIVVACVADCATLLLECLARIQFHAYGYDLGDNSIFWCKARGMLYQMSTMISLTTICFSSIDQYLSTNHRYGVRQMSTLKLAQRLTVINIGVWSLNGIPFGIFYVIVPSKGCTPVDEGFNLYYSFAYLVILNGTLPLFTSAIFSLLSFRNVRRIVRRQIPIVRRRLDQQLTAMVLTRVLFLFIVSIPFGIQLIYNLNMSNRGDDLIRLAIEDLVINITSSFFFFNYAVRILLFIF